MNTSSWQIRLIQLLSVLGMVIAFYLAIYHTGNLLVSCGEDGATWFGMPVVCSLVSGATSVYSSFLGIPIANIGFFGYIVIFFVIWLSDWIPAVKSVIRELVLGLVGFGFLFTLYLTYIEAFVIKAWCRYCVYSAIVMTVMFLIALTMLRRRPSTT